MAVHDHEMGVMEEAIHGGTGEEVIEEESVPFLERAIGSHNHHEARRRSKRPENASLRALIGTSGRRLQLGRVCVRERARVGLIGAPAVRPIRRGLAPNHHIQTINVRHQPPKPENCLRSRHQAPMTALAPENLAAPYF